MSGGKQGTGPWHLVLMIWGDAYSDERCNRIIDAALRYSAHCKGVTVLTDRTDRAIDPRAQQLPIPTDFDTPRMKTGGLPVKISMFDIPGIPKGDTCIYLDLDTIITGNLDRLAALVERAPIWTIPVFPRPFSALYRFLWKVTGRRVYAIGNSSAFVWLNGFEGNPAEAFRSLRERGALPEDLYHDDRFVAWSCQDRIRGLSINDVVNFRFEYLAPTMWLSHVFAILRRKARRNIAAVTFAGPKTKPELLMSLPENARIVDHHGRVARWNDFHMGELKSKMARDL